MGMVDDRGCPVCGLRDDCHTALCGIVGKLSQKVSALEDERGALRERVADLEKRYYKHLAGDMPSPAALNEDLRRQGRRELALELKALLDLELR